MKDISRMRMRNTRTMGRGDHFRRGVLGHDPKCNQFMK